MKPCLLILFLLVELGIQAANVAPAIFSSTNYQVVLPRTATLAALVIDDGLPSGVVTQLWAKVSGPGSVTFSNAASTITDALFSQAGTYVVSFTASDTSLSTTTNTTVTVYPSPCKLHVMVSGTGAGTVNGYSSNFTVAYNSTTSITLTSTPSAGSAFIGWVGADYVGTVNPITLSVDSTKDITAFFEVQNLATNLYYVATNGSDSASGRTNTPWLTLAKAVSTVTNGSRVIVGPGEYNEYVTCGVSGTPTLPIVFEGTRDTNGAWLTVIDPSTTISNGWVASSFATNTWELSGLAFDPKELEIDHKRVCYTFTNGFLTDYLGSPVQFTNFFYTNGLALGLIHASNLFNMPANNIVYGYHDTNNAYLMNMWDGLEALWTTSGGNSAPWTCYIRFRNGDNPNGKNIRISKNQNGYVLAPGAGGRIDYPAFGLNLRSNVTVRNFLIRGAYGQVECGSLANNNTIENNQLVGGFAKVFIGLGGSGTPPNGNVVRNNDMPSNYYGYDDCGAWETTGDPPQYKNVIRQMVYADSKYLMGWGNTWDESITMVTAGNNNSVYGNHIYNGGGGDGIYTYNTSAPAADGTKIWDNVIENQASTGMLLLSWQTNHLIFDNLISDCDVSFRLGLIGLSGETVRYTDIFRNTGWLPDGVGDQIYFHFGSVSAYQPTYWIYHNSFSGGRYSIEWGNGSTATGGTTNTHIINNILTDSQSLAWYPPSFGTTASYVGDFAYNMLKTATHTAWYGAGNIDQSTNEWASTPAMGFALVTGSPAIGTAIDTSSTFTLQSVSYPALPDTAVKIGSAWDMGASEFVPPTPVATGVLDVGLGVLWKQ